MAPRRNIKFNHRNGHSSSADGRRSSFSDISEGASERDIQNHTGAEIKSEVSRAAGLL
jgi:hypothetical protein